MVFRIADCLNQLSVLGVGSSVIEVINNDVREP